MAQLVELELWAPFEHHLYQLKRVVNDRWKIIQRNKVVKEITHHSHQNHLQEQKEEQVQLPPSLGQEMSAEKVLIS